MPNFKYYNPHSKHFIGPNGITFLKSELCANGGNTVENLRALTGFAEAKLTSGYSLKIWRRWLSYGSGPSKVMGKVKRSRKPRFTFVDPNGRVPTEGRK